MTTTWLDRNPMRRVDAATAVLVASTKKEREVLQHIQTRHQSLLEAHPDVKLDWYLAEAVLSSRGYSEQLAWLREQCKGHGNLGSYTLQDVLDKFLLDSVRRDFLAYYIEAWKIEHMTPAS